MEISNEGKRVDFLGGIKGQLEYRRVKKAFEKATQTVNHEFSDQLLRNEDGKIIEWGENYIAGLQIGQRLTPQQILSLEQEANNVLGESLQAIQDFDIPHQSMAQLGIASIDLALPIVDIPNVSYNNAILSVEQKAQLVEKQRNLHRSGSIMLQVVIQPATMKGGIYGQAGLPMSLKMDDDLDTQVQIAFTPSFKGQKTKAEKVLGTIVEAINKIKNIQALPSIDSSLPQLPETNT